MQRILSRYVIVFKELQLKTSALTNYIPATYVDRGIAGIQ